VALLRGCIHAIGGTASGTQQPETQRVVPRTTPQRGRVRWVPDSEDDQGQERSSRQDLNLSGAGPDRERCRTAPPTSLPSWCCRPRGGGTLAGRAIHVLQARASEGPEGGLTGSPVSTTWPVQPNLDPSSKLVMRVRFPSPAPTRRPRPGANRRPRPSSCTASPSVSCPLRARCLGVALGRREAPTRSRSD